MKNSIQKFQNALSDAERQVLQLCLQEAMQALPEDAVPWYLGDAPSPTGYFKPEHAKALLSRSKRQSPECAIGHRADAAPRGWGSAR